MALIRNGVQSGIEVVSGGNVTTNESQVQSSQLPGCPPGGVGGTNDYNKLKEETLPSINNVKLKYNKTSKELGLQDAGDYIEDADFLTNQDIQDILNM